MFESLDGVRFASTRGCRRGMPAGALISQGIDGAAVMRAQPCRTESEVRAAMESKRCNREMSATIARVETAEELAQRVYETVVLTMRAKLGSL